MSKKDSEQGGFVLKKISDTAQEKKRQSVCGFYGP